MRSVTFLSCLAVCGLGLSACLTIPSSSGGRLGGIPAGIEGNWADANGITSSFYNGVFETRSADTHEKLSEGNYTFQSPNLIGIEMRSLVRGTVSRVSCTLASSSRLLCTTESGIQFALNRLN